MAGNVYENVLPIVALTVASRTANSAVNGVTVDRNQAGQGYMRNITFLVFTGTLTDGAVVFKVQDSPDNSTWTDSTATLGTVPTTAATDDDKTFIFAYTGAQRYARVVATQSGATSGGVYGAVALLGGGRRSPVR